MEGKLQSLYKLMYLRMFTKRNYVNIILTSNKKKQDNIFVVIYFASIVNLEIE